MATSSTSSVDLFGAGADATATIDLTLASPKLAWPAYPNLEDLDRFILKLVQFINRAQFDFAEIEEAKVQRLQARLGIRNIPVLSMSLVRDARVLYERGQADRALSLLNSAAKISPQLSQIHLLRLNLNFRHQPLALRDNARILFDYGRSRFHGFRNQIKLLVAALFVLLGTFLLALGFFVVVQALKYLRSIIYFIAQFSPTWLSQMHVLLILFLILLSPIVLGLGPMLSLGFFLILLWPFQGDSERRIGVLNWLFLLSVPVLALIFATPILQSRSIEMKIVRVLFDADSNEQVKAVEQYVESKAGARDIHALMALAQAEIGRAHV